MLLLVGLLTVASDVPSSKLRVENLHYDLTEDDLDVRHNKKMIDMADFNAGRISSIELGPS